MAEYQIIRSQRRSISIEVTRDAGVIVRAPLRAPKKLIEGFVEQKQDWISARTAQARQNLEQRKNFAISEGSSLLFLGREYPVSLMPGARPQFNGKRFIFAPGEPGEIKQAAERLYRSLAQEYLPQRVAEFSRRTGLSAESVKVNGAAKRWGSCSGRNRLNFTWRLILAPPGAVDYVVVHELAHTLHHNHSTSFWKLVETILPDYRESEKLLLALQNRLETENWGKEDETAH